MLNISDEELLVAFTTYLLTQKRVAKNTFLAYKNDLEQLLDFLHEKKTNLTTSSRTDIKNFIKHLKDTNNSAKSISRKISAIKNFFTFLEQYCNFENKSDTLVFPKIEKTLPSFLSDEEIGRLFASANEDNSDKGVRNKVIVHLLYSSGMRVSELVNIKIDQIRFNDGILQVVGKGSKERIIPLPKPTLDLLKYYLDNVHKKLLPKNGMKENYLFQVFSHQKIRPITRQSIWNILKSILQKAQINKNISPHSLRHSLATHMLKNGANIRFLQMLLGHEQISTVQIYTHLDTRHLREIYDKSHPRA